MYTLEVVLSFVHPGPIQLIKVTLSVLMICTMAYMKDKTVNLNL